MQLITCSLIIITILTAIVLNFVYQEYIEFIEPKDAFLELKDDPFFKRMSPCDIYARDCRSKNEYIGKYKNSLKTFTIWEKIKIAECIRSANDFIRPYPRLHSLNWRIVKLRSKMEGNMPHTIAGLIILNETNLSDVNLTSYLIHEKIHLYQKNFPVETDELIKIWGFKRSKIQNYLLRNNPDTDNQIYLFNGTTMATIYKSSEPKDVLDVVVLADIKKLNFSNKIYEASHPFEIMAYELESLLQGDSSSKGLSGTEEWMQTFL